MLTEQIQDRIETYTATLPNAVQSSNGAQFALMLSLIASNQEAYTPLRTPNAEGEFTPPQPVEPRYANPNEFYSAPVVERLNQSVHSGQRGEFAYLMSQVAVQSEIPFY